MRTWGAGLHWSYHDRAWCGFMVFLPDGRLYLRHELSWRRKSPSQAATDIKTVIDAIKKRGDRFLYVAAQPELWLSDQQRPGVPEAETFSRAGVPMVQASTDVPNGWANLRNWLEDMTFFDPAGKAFTHPAFFVHPDCQRFLRTFPTLVANEEDTTQVVDDPDQHPASGVRHFLMSRPFPRPTPERVLRPSAIGNSLREAREALSGD